MSSVRPASEHLDSPNLAWEAWRRPDHYHPDLPVLKKAIERWVNDFHFRRDFEVDPIGSLERYGLDLPVQDLQIMVNQELAESFASDDPATPLLVRQYRQFIMAKRRHCIEVRDTQPNHSGWRRWRQRMIHSTFWREGPSKHAKLVHAPFSIELTQGCSVGCWFCGVDAARYQGPLEVNAATESIWKSMLTAFRNVAGQDAAQHGFCYWATDPLDHPQYEWFLEEFHRILGYWPQTTTAQVMKHPERMRKLLEHVKDRNAFVQRFSMIRSGDLDAIHKFFTAEELMLVELIPQYDDRLSPKATAGRVRQLVLEHQRNQKPIPIHYNLESTGSIACVSGFLVNLVQRSLKLITPCLATDRWPLGYRVLGELNFDEPEQIEPLLLHMLKIFINDRLHLDDQLYAHPGVQFGYADGGRLCVTKYGYTFSIPGITDPAQLADLLSENGRTVAEICALRSRAGVDNVYTSITLNQLFDKGVFDEGFIDGARRLS